MQTHSLLVITFLTVSFLFMPEINGFLPMQAAQRPLCVSQLTLANYACGRLPQISLAPEAQSPSSNLVYMDDHSPDHSDHGSRHKHRRQPRQERHHDDTPTSDCCRWLNDLDDECICELLVRLPPFLARPMHLYTVVIGESCNVTYTCSARRP